MPRNSWYGHKQLPTANNCIYSTWQLEICHLDHMPGKEMTCDLHLAFLLGLWGRQQRQGQICEPAYSRHQSEATSETGLKAEQVGGYLGYSSLRAAKTLTRRMPGRAGFHLKGKWHFCWNTQHPLLEIINHLPWCQPVSCIFFVRQYVQLEVIIIFRCLFAFSKTKMYCL